MSKGYHSLFLLPSQTKRKLLLVALLYFAEGLPFGLVYITLPVYLRTQGVDLVKIGLLSLAGLAWTLKPLWAPWVDTRGKKYQWMLASLWAMGLLVVLIASFPLGNAYLPLVLLLAFCSATLDIAVDGYTIELLEEEELGPGNGVRVSAYRVALILSGGGLVAASEFLGFKGSLFILAATFFILGLWVALWPACHHPSPASASSLWKAYLHPFLDLWKRPHAWAVILFVLLFKVGDAMMGPMVYPFWVDRGFSKVEIGLISGTLGTICSILGSLAGGWLTGWLGIGRALWSLGAAQALSNLGYTYAALTPGKWPVYGASVVESFTGGLGTAAFLAFLMRLTRKEMSASQYALLATLFSFSRTIAGALSGFGAQRFGYAAFFFYTFLAALPAFVLLPWVLKSLQAPLKEVTIKHDLSVNTQGGES